MNNLLNLLDTIESGAIFSLDRSFARSAAGQARDEVNKLLDLFEKVVKQSRPPSFVPHGSLAYLPDKTIEEIIDFVQSTGREFDLEIRK